MRVQVPHVWQCDHNLSEYMMLHKLTVGLHNSVLKREVFQSCTSISSVKELRSKCVSFETPVRDAVVRCCAAVAPAGSEGPKLIQLN